MLARLFALILLLAGAPAAAETIVVHAGRLIADASRPAAGPSTITIVDGRIQSVTAGLTPAPAGARLIDLSNRTVLPGLIDMHVHLSGDPQRRLLARGGGHRRICDLGRGEERPADPARRLHHGARPRLRPRRSASPSPAPPPRA